MKCCSRNPNIHDREIRIDNGWIVKIGRSLDFYQKPNGGFEIGANDMSLRKCLETKVDIYRGVDACRDVRAHRPTPGAARRLLMLRALLVRRACWS